MRRSALTAERLARPGESPVSWPDAWRHAVAYLVQGLASVRRAPRLYLLITMVYATPALVVDQCAHQSDLLGAHRPAGRVPRVAGREDGRMGGAAAPELAVAPLWW